MQPNSIKVPACDRNEAIQTLSAIGGGTALGAGKTFRTDIEAIRNEYKSRLSLLAEEIAAKRAKGVPDAEIRPWAIAERTRIAQTARVGGRVSTVVLEMRDAMKYGRGARTPENLVQKTLLNPKFRDSGLSLDEYLIRSAVRSNTGITESVIRAGKYLKYGGKILVPLGIAGSAYAVATAKPEDRLKAAGEEGASWVGGAVASEAAVALMVVLAPETGGLTLLGVALVVGAGAAGGGLSGWGFHKLFFTNHPQAQHVVQSTGTLPASMVHAVMPPPPVTRSGSR